MAAHICWLFANCMAVITALQYSRGTDRNTHKTQHRIHWEVHKDLPLCPLPLPPSFTASPILSPAACPVRKPCPSPSPSPQQVSFSWLWAGALVGRGQADPEWSNAVTLCSHWQWRMALLPEVFSWPTETNRTFFTDLGNLWMKLLWWKNLVS